MTKPEIKFRAGGCSASIFSNEFSTPDGPRTAKNVVLEKTYKDKEGNFQTSKSLGVNDLPRAILVLQKAYDHIVSPGREPSLVPNVPKDLSAEPSK